MNSFFANIGKELATNILSKSSSQPLNSHIYCVTPTQSEIQLSKELLTKSSKSSNRQFVLESHVDLMTSHQMILSYIKKVQSQVYIKSNYSNYRLISLLSIKKVEHLICSQFINTHLIANSLLIEHQWGFRTQRSTEDTILHMTKKMERSAGFRESNWCAVY